MHEVEPCPLNNRRAKDNPKNTQEAHCFAIHDALKVCRAAAHFVKDADGVQGGDEGEFSAALARVESLIANYRNDERRRQEARKRNRDAAAIARGESPALAAIDEGKPRPTRRDRAKAAPL
jgi:hypothetical protein